MYVQLYLTNVFIDVFVSSFGFPSYQDCPGFVV